MLPSLWYSTLYDMSRLLTILIFLLSFFYTHVHFEWSKTNRLIFKARNSLTGNIPTEIGDLEALEDIRLSKLCSLLFVCLFGLGICFGPASFFLTNQSLIQLKSLLFIYIVGELFRLFQKSVKRRRELLQWQHPHRNWPPQLSHWFGSKWVLFWNSFVFILLECMSNEQTHFPI